MNRFIFLIGFVMFLMACSKECDIKMTVDIPVSIQLQILSEVVSEKQIESAYLFLVREEIVYYAIQLEKDILSPSGFKTILLHLDPDDLGERFNCHLFANIEPYIKSSRSEDYIGKHIDTDIQQKFIYTNLSSDHFSSGLKSNGMVMWGKTQSIFNKTNPHVKKTFNLFRALSRVSVSVEVEADVFTLDSVFIFRPNTGYHFMPSGFRSYNTATTIIDKQSAIEPDVSVIPTSFKFVASLSKSADPIYIAESKVTDVALNRRCAIVVGGYYNNSPTLSYYRIDFEKDVIRNHDYTVRINVVKGVGHRSAMEAYNTDRPASKTMHMSGDTDLTATITSCVFETKKDIKKDINEL